VLILLAAAVAGACLVALFTGSAVSRAAPGCAHADDTRAQASLSDLAKATVCLINRERADRDKHRLDSNAKLRAAAKGHTETMLEKDCFKHRCPNEPSLDKRLHKSGYLEHAVSWRYAEDIGCALRPRKMVELFMKDRFNRRNLINAKYRDVGVGAGRGVPSKCNDNQNMSTFTVVFARRQP
jgi:uncharacterized protein YkwD